MAKTRRTHDEPRRAAVLNVKELLLNDKEIAPLVKSNNKIKAARLRSWVGRAAYQISVGHSMHSVTVKLKDGSGNHTIPGVLDQLRWWLHDERHSLGLRAIPDQKTRIPISDARRKELDSKAYLDIYEVADYFDKDVRTIRRWFRSLDNKSNITDRAEFQYMKSLIKSGEFSIRNRRK